MMRKLIAWKNWSMLIFDFLAAPQIWMPYGDTLKGGQNKMFYIGFYKNGRACVSGSVRMITVICLITRYFERNVEPH